MAGAFYKRSADLSRLTDLCVHRHILKQRFLRGKGVMEHFENSEDLFFCKTNVLKIKISPSLISIQMRRAFLVKSF